jgi:predicted small secreted protein
MRSRPVHLIVAALVILACVGTACARNTVQTAGGDVALADSTSVVIDNQGLTDMTIYVLEAGSVRRRLGVAGAVQRTRLSIPRGLVGNGRDLQFLADPIAARGNSISRRIYVVPGDQVSLTILP